MSDSIKTDEKMPQADISTTEYKNDHLVVKVQKYPGCQIKMGLTVSKEAAIAAYKKAMKSISKEVLIPGFRKGKAPEAMLIQNFGTHIDREWNEVLLQTSFHEAINLTKIYPLNENSVKKPHVKSASRDSGAEISIEFESSPSVPEISPESLELHAVAKKEITQNDIKDALHDIRLHHSEWSDVTDRPVEEGDYIDVDIQDHANPDFYICKNTRFEVAKGKMGDWMRKLVLGKNHGDVVVGMSEPTQEMDSSVEFKATDCQITIKAIKQAKLADLDDALAKKLGVENTQQIEEKVRLSLEQEAKETVQQKLRDQLNKILLEKYPFEIPASLIQSEMKSRTNQKRKELEHKGKSSSEIAQKMDHMKHDIEKEVRENFQAFFIARNIAEKNNIHITQEELFKELMFQMYTKTAEPKLDPEEARSKAYIDLLTKKVEDFLISQAKIQ